MQRRITRCFKSLFFQRVLSALLMLVIWQGLFCVDSFGETDAPSTALAPVDHGGAPWRIAYLESRPFENYAATLANMIKALHRMGWIKSIDGLPYVKGQTDAKVIWDWMAKQQEEPYLKFVQDGFYTFDGLNKDQVSAMADQISRRIREAKDVDLLLVMGTQGAQKMAHCQLPVPILAMSISNAKEAGIVQGNDFSGDEHVWAHMDPYRYKRQIDIFYDIFKFKTLGVVMDPDLAGRSFAAVDDVLKAAKEHGFKVVIENVPQPQKYTTNKEQFSTDLEAAFARLAPRVDAVYLGLFIGNDPKALAQELSPLTQNRIPVFAQQSSDVASGALMSLARQDFSGVGNFDAAAMVRVLKGELPSKIPQVYESSPNIIINLDVAKQIGFRPHFDLLLGADQIIKTAK
jgi:ABC-type uncharacterized transport system substrate-binding protein